MRHLTKAPAQDLLRGLPLLLELISNHSVTGGLPYEMIDQVNVEFDIDIRDLLSSAVGQDRDGVWRIEVRALEQAAQSMGRRDGARVIAARRGLSFEMNTEDLHELLGVTTRIPQGSPAAYQGILSAYATGVRAAGALLWLEHNSPMERRRQLTESRIIRESGEPIAAELLVETTRRELDAVPRGDLSSYAPALAAAVIAEESAKVVAAKALGQRVIEEVQRNPRLSTMEALRRARLAYRTVTEGPLLQRAYQRAAWIAIPMNELKERARDARSRIRETTGQRSPRA